MYMNKCPGAHPGCVCTYVRGSTYTGVWEEEVTEKDRERGERLFLRHIYIYVYIYIYIYMYMCIGRCVCVCVRGTTPAYIHANVYICMPEGCSNLYINGGII